MFTVAAAPWAARVRVWEIREGSHAGGSRHRGGPDVSYAQGVVPKLTAEGGLD
jgi:hypothetical protein